MSKSPSKSVGATPLRRASPIPGVALLSVATTVLLIVALLPRVGNQPTPPTVAEFAPQAAKQILKTLSSQSALFENGAGPCLQGPLCTKPHQKSKQSSGGGGSPQGQHIQCFGDPPRQIADPQSPPCVPFWQGDNGGGTSVGVTANQITVALPVLPFEQFNLIKDLADFFNDHFEMYKRKITLMPINEQVLDAQPNPSQEIADEQVVRAMPAFASLSYAGQAGAEQGYYDSLARDHIISIAHRAGAKTSESYLSALAPYRWSVLPGIDTMQRHIAEMICKVLKGGPPQYAGPGIKGSTRIFGLIHGRASDGTEPDLSLLRSAVQECRAAPVVDVEYQGSSDQSTASTNATNAMLKMVQANVTSVICVCDIVDVSRSLMPAASSEQFRPEWIMSSYIDNDTDNAFAQAPPDESTHVIGTSFRNKWLPREDMPWYWAIKDVDAGADPGFTDGYYLAARYSSLLLLASGIQLAGPNLTPQTFQRGLQAAQFPNPGAGVAPYFQARVGFDGDRHTMIHDATLYWYSASDKGTVDPTSLGAICYVNRGVRFTLGGWPQGPQQFQGACRQ